jgi:hypothetical protein
VVINQINMTSEVFFDSFEKDQLLHLDFEECFKLPPSFFIGDPVAAVN